METPRYIKQDGWIYLNTNNLFSIKRYCESLKMPLKDFDKFVERTRKELVYVPELDVKLVWSPHSIDFIQTNVELPAITAKLPFTDNAASFLQTFVKDYFALTEKAKQIESDNAEKEGLLEQNYTEIKDYQAKIYSLETTIREINNALAEKNENFAIMQEALHEKNIEIEQLQKSLNDLQVDYNIAVETSNRNLQAWEEEKRMLETEKSELLVKFHEKGFEISNIQEAEIWKEKEADAKIEALQAKVSDMEKQLQQKDNVISQLTTLNAAQISAESVLQTKKLFEFIANVPAPEPVTGKKQK